MRFSARYRKSMNETGTSAAVVKRSVHRRRPHSIGASAHIGVLTTRAISRGVEAYLQREFAALTVEQFKAVAGTYLYCQVADRPDNQNEILQRLHRRDLARFAELCGGV